MLSIIISSLAFIFVTTSAIVFYFQAEKVRNEARDNMQSMVDQINDAQFYEYKFDKKQEENIKNLDKNINNVNDNVVKLQNNVRFLEKDTVRRNDIAKEVKTQSVTAQSIATNKFVAGNPQSTNNIVLEAGNTTDGSNTGFSAINFNGFFNKTDQLINKNKSRWRVAADQRSTADFLSIDQYDKNKNYWQYMYMSDGSLGVNNNKMRFSNKYTDFTEKATDKSEISNDTSGFKKLMIVGNKSGGGNVRRVGVWDQLDVHGNQHVDGQMSANVVQARNTLTAKTMSVESISSQRGINVTANDPGPFVEKSYGSLNNRYGVGQFPGATTRVYSGTANTQATVNLSLAQANGTFDDVVKVKTNRDVDFVNNVNVAQGVNANNVTVRGNINAQNIQTNTLNIPTKVNVLNGDPGAMIEKRYGANDADRYGLGQFPNGTLRMYTAGAFPPASVNLSIARPNNTFEDALKVKTDGNIDIPKSVAVGNNVSSTNFQVRNNGSINADSRMHIRGNENLYLLNKGGVIVGKADGGNGNLSVEGNLNMGPNVSITNTDGHARVNSIQLGNKFRLSGVGDKFSNDDWMRVMNTANSGLYGGVAAGKIWSQTPIQIGSDIRMKKDISSLSQDDVNKVTQLEPKRYVYRDDPKNRVQFGLIAQDVEKLYPNVVENGANGMKSLRYNDLVPLVIGKLKQMEGKKEICIDDVCLTKDDLIKLKSL